MIFKSEIKIIDISWPISENITQYKNYKELEFKKIKTFENDNVRQSTITISSHTGTHVDASAHFYEYGKTVDNIPLSKIIGFCTVLDLSNVNDCITKEHINNYTFERSRTLHDSIILLKTSNSYLDSTANFNNKFVYLTPDAASFLAESKIKAVGIDYLGIERDQPDHETHKILFKNNVTIVEGLRLADVQEGNYYFICLPLYVLGLEAAPARAILIKN